MSANPARVGVLIVRIWVEVGSEVRARITASTDIAQRHETTVMASSVDEACELVRNWLNEFVANGPGR